MAKKQLVIITSDITGEDITGKRGAGTVEFAVDGVRYEIDLSAEERAELTSTLKPYTTAGRKVVNAVRRLPEPQRSPARTDAAQLQEQRRWWKENYQAAGLPEPKDKGRIPAAVIEAHREHDGRRVVRAVPPAFAAA